MSSITEQTSTDYGLSSREFLYGQQDKIAFQAQEMKEERPDLDTQESYGYDTPQDRDAYPKRRDRPKYVDYADEDAESVGAEQPAAQPNIVKQAIEMAENGMTK